MQLSLRGQFFAATRKSWEMDGRTGTNWSVKVLQEEDMAILKAKGDQFTEADFPDKFTEVECVVESQTFDRNTSLLLTSMKVASKK